MIFGKDYYTPLERDYIDPQQQPRPDVHDVGMSVVAGISGSGTELVNAAIRKGVGQVHIEMSGIGKASGQSQTPGIYGRDLRQAMKDLAEVNEVTLTHHAPFNMMGFSGQDQQGNFSDEQRKMFIDELKRNIDFSADIGSDNVTIHTGEFKRPISEQPWAGKNGQSGYYFREFEEEPDKAQFIVVDKRTGRVVKVVEKSEQVARPVWKVASKEDEKTYVADYDDEALGIKKGQTVEVKEGDYVDYEGRKVHWTERVPEFDKEKGRFKVEVQSWDHFVKEAEEHNRKMEEEMKRPLTPEEKWTPEEAFMKASLETNEGHSRGWALQYAQDFQRTVDRLEKLKKAKEMYEKLEKSMPEEEKWRLLRSDPEFGGVMQEFVPADQKYPTEILDQAIKDMRRQVEFSRQSSAAQQQQAEDARATKDNVISASKYALSKSVMSYAEAGIHAMKQSKEKPIYIALENIFPESYGGHPQELKHLVFASRKKMAEILHDKGYSKAESEKIAEKHIKATFDTGHVNVWRRFWRGSDEDFKKWMLKQTEDLAKSGVIGMVHLADNFGYQDDHLTPGQGNTPVREMMDIFKKYGYDKHIVVEPGADATLGMGDIHGLMNTWNHLDSPIYAADRATSFTKSMRWTDVHHGYFGQTYAPNFIFGGYAPSNEWTLWSQVPLE